jgi:hypothetical protein
LITIPAIVVLPTPPLPANAIVIAMNTPRKIYITPAAGQYHPSPGSLF